MDAAARSPFTPQPGCPRCGSSAGSPFWSGGVCLRCAGAHLLNDAAVDGAGTPAVGPPLRQSGDPGLPERIGPYEVLEELGRGGMGRVYAARQIGLGRIVALKVMGNVGKGGDFELRFLREAQTAARLRHPNLVAVHDFGRADGQLYFSMDYIEGGDLARRLRGRPFASWEAASLLRKVALALAHAHDQGVLHRDLKPSNILLDGDEPKLADFGLAAQLEAGGDLTTTSGILGTPHYLAPEALRAGSAALSVASDIYALRVVLFELLTGRTPFAGAVPGALIALVENSGPPSPRLLAPAVARDLEVICLRCLERDPARRYASAAALADDLRRFLDGEAILARPASALDRFVRWGRRRPALAAVWVLITALAIGSTLAVVMIQRSLRRAQQAEARSRDLLRGARLAEARAVLRTTQPGRRAQALAALVEATSIRPGADLRVEAIAAVMTSDIQPMERWEVSPEVPGEMAFSATTRVLGFEADDATGQGHEPAVFRRWGETRLLGRVVSPGTNAAGLIRISPDGTHAMERFFDDTLRVWRIGEPRPFLTLRDRPSPGGPQRVPAFNDDHDFSPDGALLVIGLPERGLSLHRVADGTEVARWADGDRFNRVKFSPDGRQIAAICTTDPTSRTVFVLESPALKRARRLTLGSSPSSIAWSGDSGLLAVSLEDGMIEVRRVPDGGLSSRFHSPMLDPNELSFVGHDSILAMRGHGTKLHLMDRVLGREETTIDGFGKSPVATLPEGDAFVTASVDGIATRWQTIPATGIRVLLPPHPGGYGGAFNNCCLDFSPDGHRAVSSHGRHLVLRDTATGRSLAETDDRETRGGEFTTVAFTDGGRNVVRASNRSGMWLQAIETGPDGDPRFGAPVRLDPERGLTLCDHSPDGRRFVLVDIGGDLVKVVERSGESLRTLGRWKVPGVYAGALAPDGDRLLVNCSGSGPEAAAQRMRVYRVADGSVLAELPGMAFGETAWSRDGQTAMTSNGQTESILWDTATWRPRARLSGPAAGNITTFALAPDGRTAAVVRDDRLHLVSTTDGTDLAVFESPQAPGLAGALRFMPDGRSVGVVWRDGRLDLFDPEAVRRALSASGLSWPVPGR